MRLGVVKSLTIDRAALRLVAYCTGGIGAIVEEFPTAAALGARWDELVEIDESEQHVEQS